MPRVKDYASLKQQVLFQLERSQDAEAQDLFDGWVSVCEAEFAPILRAPYMVRRATLNYGERPEERFAYLPPSYVAMGYILGPNGQELDPVNPSDEQYFKTGPAQVYSISGYAIRVFPDPQPYTSFPLTVEYFSRQETLTEENVSNDVIVNHPSVYLYGTLAEAALGYGEDTMYNRYVERFANAINSANEMEAGWRRGSGAAVRVNR